MTTTHIVISDTASVHLELSLERINHWVVGLNKHGAQCLMYPLSGNMGPDEIWIHDYRSAVIMTFFNCQEAGGIATSFTKIAESINTPAMVLIQSQKMVTHEMFMGEIQETISYGNSTINLMDPTGEPTALLSFYQDAFEWMGSSPVFIQKSGAGRLVLTDETHRAVIIPRYIGDDDVWAFLNEKRETIVNPTLGWGEAPVDVTEPFILFGTKPKFGQDRSPRPESAVRI